MLYAYIGTDDINKLSKNKRLAMMSGSGPSVFGIFKDEENAERAAVKIKELGYEPEICLPL